MSRAKQGTHRARLRQVTLLDRRGRVLAFADSLVIRGRTAGLMRISCSPTGAAALAAGRDRVTVRAGGRVVLELTGLRLHFHTGVQRARDGTAAYEAAIGTVGAVQRRRV